MDGATEQDFDLVFQGATLFTGTEMLPKPMSVGVKAGRIASVSAERLEGTEVIDSNGRWLTPGLIESHIHLYDFGNATDSQKMEHYLQTELPKNLRSFLEHGITSVKSVGDPVPELLATREMINSGDLLGPRLFMTGVGISAPDGHPSATVYGRNPWYRKRAAAEVATPDEVREVVNQMVEYGVDAIKLLLQGGCRCCGEPEYKWHGMVPITRMKPDVLEAAIEESHKLGKKVTVHTFEQSRAIEALEAGADGVEHGVVDEEISDNRFVDLLLKNDASYVPTLWVYPRPNAYKNLVTVRDAGVRIALGSDSFPPTVKLEGIEAGMFGANSIVEAERMELAGLSALEALVSATGNASAHLGKSDIGVITEGAHADLVLFDSDPTESVANWWNPSLVVSRGEIVVRN